MIQFTQNPVTTRFSIRVDLYNYMSSSGQTNLYQPLIVYKSQFTGKEKIALPSTSIYTNAKDRYIAITQDILASGGTEDLSVGDLLFGTSDFPYGFYDVIIYENNSSVNMTVSNTIKRLYTGLMTIELASGTVNYSEYTTNDTDTESVYITA
tara:strand:- start:47 stop:502 length:456 start_codon:yes stop_codon:yes gene_type:complete